MLVPEKKSPQLGLLTVSIEGQEGHRTLTWGSSCSLPSAVRNVTLIAHGLREEPVSIGKTRGGRSL